MTMDRKKKIETRKMGMEQEKNRETYLFDTSNSR
jgi:hypothetical protein